jgi:hypothetical protein
VGRHVGEEVGEVREVRPALGGASDVDGVNRGLDGGGPLEAPEGDLDFGRRPRRGGGV